MLQVIHPGTTASVSIKPDRCKRKKLKIIPLGGLGEFGMNCLALRWEDDIIVIDAGLMFPETRAARRRHCRP